MRRSSVPFLCAAVLCLLDGAHASASPLQVRYEVTVGLSVFGQVLPPDSGPLGTGLLTVWYQAPASLPVGATGPSLMPLPGPATLLPARMDLRRVTLGSHAPSSMILGLRSLTLMVDIELARGSLNSAGTLLLPDVRGDIRGKNYCAGAGGFCGGVFSFSRLFMVSPVLDAWTAPAHLVAGDLRASALKSLLFTGPSQDFFPPLILMGIHIMDAREIDRMVVPEPGSLPLAAGGLAALALFAARRRRHA